MHVRRLPAAEPPGAVLAGRHADAAAEDLLLHLNRFALVHRIIKVKHKILLWVMCVCKIKIIVLAFLFKYLNFFIYVVGLYFLS